MERNDECFLVVPPDPRYLRSVRLVTADAGWRAGLSVSEIDDLRMAVGELTQALTEASRHRVAFRIVVDRGRVLVRASARRGRKDPVPRLTKVPALIVDAVTDCHELGHSPSEMWFVVAKTAGGVDP